MAKHGKKSHAPPPAPPEKDESEVRWLISYSDFMMQLVCLFILLYSVANLDKDKAAKVATFYRASIGLGDPPEREENPPGDRLAVGDRPLVGGEMGGADLPPDLPVTVEDVPGGWKMSFQEELFDVGSAALTTRGVAALDSAGAVLHPYVGRIVVTGTAGDTPQDVLEGSAIRLASARAEAAVVHLTRPGPNTLDLRFMSAAAEVELPARRVIIILRTE